MLLTSDLPESTVRAQAEFTFVAHSERTIDFCFFLFYKVFSLPFDLLVRIERVKTSQLMSKIIEQHYETIVTLSEHFAIKINS